MHSSTTSSAPTARRAPGTSRPTSPRSWSRASTSSAPRPGPSAATGEVVFLGWPDGELESGLRQRWEVAYWIRRLRPDVVLGHDPWKRYRLHPDHRHAGLLVCDGIVAARDPHFFPEQQLPHHRPSTLLLWEADEPDHAEDVTATVDRKLAALEAHESQFESTMKATDDEQLAAFRDPGPRAPGRQRRAGRPAGGRAVQADQRSLN